MITRTAPGRERKPPWLSVSTPPAGAFRATARVLERLRLHTVCDEARCPNRGECYAAGTATFLILGDTCSRACRFCAVRHGRPSGTPDADEPRRVAEAARLLALRHVVMTSVTRDDLNDGGASQFAAAVRELRLAVPAAGIEVLVPDFGGDRDALAVVLAERPDVLNHNLETVPRLSPSVRPQSSHARSVELLRRAAAWRQGSGRPVKVRHETEAPGGSGERRRRGFTLDPARSLDLADSAVPRPVVKTGFMLGLGESWDEVESLLDECRTAGVDLVTVGQYLQPRRDCLSVARFIRPEEFAALERRGASIGLRVIAGPFVRSSYRAGERLREVVR